MKRYFITLGMCLFLAVVLPILIHGAHGADECHAPAVIKLTATDGSKVYILTAQITQVGPEIKGMHGPSARAIVIESAGFQQAVRETPEAVDALLEACK